MYRTWRPKSFTDLVGQDAVVRTLRTALTSGKLAHAYLFSGPRGSGKTSAAKILARCIDCVAGPTPEPDNTCENCLAMLAGSALDVIEVDAASNRGIEEIRALRESVKFAPASMRMKVFIIDEAHMLTREGANAFLKTLEEPPAHAVFILATTAPEALPPTILSRCQRYAFRRIPISVMIERMRAIAAAEGIAIDDGALGAIAYRADGGLRDALTMLEQVAAYAGGAVDAATVEAAFGATGQHYARVLVAAILAGEAGAALRIVDEASDAGADMLGLIRGAIGEYRNLLVARIDRDLLARDLSAADAQTVVTLAGATPQPRVVRGLRLLADALTAGRSSGNPRLEIETALLRLIVQGEDPSLDALATRVALLESGGQGAAPPVAARPVPDRAAVAPPPSAPNEPPPRAQMPHPADAGSAERTLRVVPQLASAAFGEAPPVVAEPSVAPAVALPDEDRDVAASPAPAGPTLQQVRSSWDQIRLRAEEKHKPLRALLSRATVDAVDAQALVIGVGDGIQEGLARDKTQLIEAAVRDVLRVPLRVVVRVRGTAAPGAPARDVEPGTAARPATGANGEIDLLAYARKKLSGTETS
ncbi:MAG: DNA polymerase III subunit gamma/tau [Vulcanimicrobiaceae bacterium]